MGQVLCFVQVREASVGVKEKWGRYDEVLRPGFHVLNCFSGSRIAGYLSLRVRQMDIRFETKTRDNVFVNIVACILYRVADENAKEAFYQLSRPQAQIQAYVFDVIRSSVPRMNLDEVFEQKKSIAKSVETELQKVMTMYGYEIVQTLIVDVIPHETVKRAMNEINAAARLREAAWERAETEKILQVKRAEAEAESKFLNGQGIARQRQAIVDGLRESVIGFSNNVPRSSPKDVLDMVLLTQYFDTMREIGAQSKTSTVFISHGPGVVQNVSEQIQNGVHHADAIVFDDHLHGHLKVEQF